MDAPAAVRGLRLVGARLRQLEADQRRRSKALDRRIRSLELVLAACISEAAFARRAEEAPAEPEAPVWRGRPEASVRGSWERPG